MKLYELLEYKRHHYQLRQNDLDIYQNPSYNEMMMLLDKYKELRGTLSKNNLYVWNAYEASHAQAIGFIGRGSGDFYFAKEGVQTGSPTWGEKLPRVSNGIQFDIGGANSEDAEASLMLPVVRRALGAKDGDLFGVNTPTPLAVARRHNVGIGFIMDQLAKGIGVEKEHTQDEAMAREIALDHLAEFPDYYDRLEKMEKQTEGEVINTKFGQKLSQKKGINYQPDAEPPVSLRDGDPFDSFDIKPTGFGKSYHIVGRRASGYEENVGTTDEATARILVRAYNAGGYSPVSIERIPLGDDFSESAVVFEKATSMEVLQKNKIPLNSEEKEKVVKAGAVWEDGKPGIWKSKTSSGKIKYVCNTHRAYQAKDTLSAAIKAFEFIKTTG